MTRFAGTVAGALLGVALFHFLLADSPDRDRWLLVAVPLGLALLGWALADLILARDRDPDPGQGA